MRCDYSHILCFGYNGKPHPLLFQYYLAGEDCYGEFLNQENMYSGDGFLEVILDL